MKSYEDDIFFSLSFDPSGETEEQKDLKSAIRDSLRTVLKEQLRSAIREEVAAAINETKEPPAIKEYKLELIEILTGMGKVYKLRAACEEKINEMAQEGWTVKSFEMAQNNMAYILFER